ncbi:alcohol dehydrogenase catalytic domain-containing protein [Paraburkholderia sp. Cy-641]|uniref:zinc-dependent alcohol dehydrogenase n=1 Tax=Paraburkholderia sp. Cy-641 TaxID=2608337 RepID=UPI00141E9B52|nr:alcohol dehydrogenase catalytic domain-containing protein [Paraburkholderia sp. Cy-641]NIF79512.1 alcohol dehydrogenase catalytic domain-containing protein [Paraburkholderia sp. Cy-641]
MKAALQTGLRKLELIEMERPEAIPGTVVLKVANIGICGSDLHPYRTFAGRSGFPMGHELSGVVVAVGEGVTNTLLGRRVTVDMVLGTACGKCAFCKRGYALHCQAREFPFGGGFAEFVRTKAVGVFPLPDAVDDQLGAIVEPVAVGVHAARRMGIGPGMTGVIVGAGTIGLSALAAALDAGSEKVYVVAKHEVQAKAALKMGAAGVLSLDLPTAAGEINQVTDGLGADYAIETVGGSADTLDFSCKLVRHLGMLGVLGAFDRGFRGLEIIEALERELTIHLPNCYSVIDGKHDFEVAIDLLARKGNVLRTMVTHEMDLAEIDEAFRIAADKSAHSIKVQIRA